MHASLSRRSLAALCLALAPALAHAAEEPAIIAKARAHVGQEAVLDAMKSVRFVGTLAMPDPADAKKEKRVQLDVVFAKPDQQLMRMTFPEGIETTGLDGMEAWHLVQAADNPTRKRLTLLPPARLRRLRAETWENLFYFRGLDRAGGTVEDNGTFTVDGVVCRKFSFVHSPAIIFRRYFEAATGRLVITETEDGRLIREEGELVVQGIRFPTKVTTLSKDDKGTVQEVTLTFDKIVVNEELPARYFSVPRLTAPGAAP